MFFDIRYSKFDIKEARKLLLSHLFAKLLAHD